MDGTYPNNTFSFINNTGSTIYTGQAITPQIMWPQEKKCKCPNPKHTQGCSIEPTGEYCEWCSKGCRKRVMAVHVSYK